MKKRLKANRGEEGTPQTAPQHVNTTARDHFGVFPVKGGVNLDHFGGAKVDQLVKG